MKKTVLVTGSSRGIGRAVALKFDSTIRGRMHVRGCALVQRGVSLRAIVY